MGESRQVPLPSQIPTVQVNLPACSSSHNFNEVNFGLGYRYGTSQSFLIPHSHNKPSANTMPRPSGQTAASNSKTKHLMMKRLRRGNVKQLNGDGVQVLGM